MFDRWMEVVDRYIEYREGQQIRKARILRERMRMLIIFWVIMMMLLLVMTLVQAVLGG